MQYYNKENRIVIFGANSMVGSYLISHLLNEQYTNIVAVVRSLSRISLIDSVAKSYNIDSATTRITIIEEDCAQYVAVEKILESGDIVFNTAAAVSMKNSDISIIDTNIKIAHSIAQSCIVKKVKALIHVSSVSTLGKCENGVTTEDIVPEFIMQKNYYAQSKFYSEGEAWRAMYSGIKVIIVNPSVIIGIGDFNGNSSARLIKKFSKGSTFGTHGITGWVSAKDVATAMERLSQCEKAYGERYVLNGENLEYGELISLIAKEFGKRGVRLYIGKRAIGFGKSVIKIFSSMRIPIGLSAQTIDGLVARRYYDNSKVRKIIGMEFTPLDSIIKECCRAFKNRK